MTAKLADGDCISRQAAIDALDGKIEITGRTNAEAVKGYVRLVKDRIERLPSAQPERLTDDDFEVIRIHLSAFKGQLGNQGRWEEAEEYQRIIDRFMRFASVQTEIIRCKDCKWKDGHNCTRAVEVFIDDDKYCAWAERR